MLTKIVNGVEETCSAEEEATIRAEWAYAAARTTPYQILRAAAYPPVTDYLDAIVKSDMEQQRAYIDACLAVKVKHPKP